MFEFYKIRVNDLSQFLKPTEEYIMALQDQLTAAQATLAADQDIVTKLQAQIDAAQPHLSVLQEIEAEVLKVPEEFHSGFAALIAKAKDLLGF